MFAVLMAAAAGMMLVPATPAALDDDNIEDLVVSANARAGILSGADNVNCYEGANTGRRNRNTRICLTQAEWIAVEQGVAAGLGAEEKPPFPHPSYWRNSGQMGSGRGPRGIGDLALATASLDFAVLVRHVARFAIGPACR